MQFPDNFTYIPIKTSLPYKIDDIDDQQDKYKDTAIGKKYSPDALRQIHYFGWRFLLSPVQWLPLPGLPVYMSPGAGPILQSQD